MSKAGEAKFPMTHGSHNYLWRLTGMYSELLHSCLVEHFSKAFILQGSKPNVTIHAKTNHNRPENIFSVDSESTVSQAPTQ